MIESDASALNRLNPNNSSQKLYKTTQSSPEKVEEALKSANAYQKVWSETNFEKRSKIIDKVADLIEETDTDLLLYRLLKLENLGLKLMATSQKQLIFAATTQKILKE